MKTFKMTMILIKKNGFLCFTEMLSNHVFVLKNTFQQITLQWTGICVQWLFGFGFCFWAHTPLHTNLCYHEAFRNESIVLLTGNDSWRWLLKYTTTEHGLPWGTLSVQNPVAVLRSDVQQHVRCRYCSISDGCIWQVV